MNPTTKLERVIQNYLRSDEVLLWQGNQHQGNNESVLKYLGLLFLCLFISGCFGWLIYNFGSQAFTMSPEDFYSWFMMGGFFLFSVIVVIISAINGSQDNSKTYVATNKRIFVLNKAYFKTDELSYLNLKKIEKSSNTLYFNELQTGNQFTAVTFHLKDATEAFSIIEKAWIENSNYSPVDQVLKQLADEHRLDYSFNTYIGVLPHQALLKDKNGRISLKLDLGKSLTITYAIPNPADNYLSIQPENLLKGVAKRLGFQDIEVNEGSKFDEVFILNTDNASFLHDVLDIDTQNNLLHTHRIAAGSYVFGHPKYALKTPQLPKTKKDFRDKEGVLDFHLLEKESEQVDNRPGQSFTSKEGNISQLTYSVHFPPYAEQNHAKLATLITLAFGSILVLARRIERVMDVE